MPEPGWLMAAYPPPEEVGEHQSEFVKHFMHVFYQKRQRYQDLEKLRCSVTRTTSFNEGLVSPLSPVQEPGEGKTAAEPKAAAEAASDVEAAPATEAAKDATDATTQLPQDQTLAVPESEPQAGTSGEGESAGKSEDTQPLTAPPRRRSVRKKAADWFRIILNLIRTSKAQRVLRVLDGIPEAELREALLETATEMSLAFEYQLAMLADTKEVHKAAEYAVSCITKYLKHKDSECSTVTFIESIIDRQPLSRRQRELHTRFPSDSKIVWHDSDLFSHPGLRVPKTGTSTAASTSGPKGDTVDGGGDGDKYDYFFCFTPYGHSCEPDRYGYRSPLGIFDKEQGEKVMLYYDKVAMKHKDVCSVKKKEKDGHQNYRPCSSCGDINWEEMEKTCPDHPEDELDGKVPTGEDRKLSSTAAAGEAEGTKKEDMLGNNTQTKDNKDEKKKEEKEQREPDAVKTKKDSLLSAEASPPKLGQGDVRAEQADCPSQDNRKPTQDLGSPLGGGDEVGAKPALQEDDSKAEPLPQGDGSKAKLVPEENRSNTEPLPQGDGSKAKLVPQEDRSKAEPMPQENGCKTDREAKEKPVEAEVIVATEQSSVKASGGSPSESTEKSIVDVEDLFVGTEVDGSSVDGPGNVEVDDLEGTSVD